MSVQHFEKEPIWVPNKNSGKRMKEFMKVIEAKYKTKFTDYWDFHKWTVDNYPELWEEIWDFSGVICSKRFNQAIDRSISIEDSPKWFEGARLNFGENMLKFRDDHLALIITGEDREAERITYKQLYEESKLYTAALRKMGLKKGDIVSCYMSNRKEPLIAMIAVASIGAVFTGGSPLLGPQAYLKRIGQVKPRVLITVDQYPYNREIKDLLQNTEEIADGLPTLEKVIIVPSKPESKHKDISKIKNSCFLDDFLNTGYNADGSVPDIVFEQVSFSHPVFINYTSGTTGVPKIIVHGFGSLMPCVRDFFIHFGTQRDDVWLSLSSVGWVSWNMVNNMLFNGTTILFFEGVPHFLSPTYTWDMIDDFKISRMFITPSTLDELQAKRYLPTEKHHLSSLKMFLCGSSVVKPKNFQFAFSLKKDVMFSVGCGSTETMGFFSLSEHTLPVYKGEIGSPCLGMGIECLDEGGKPLIGELGEFVITTPSPGFPLYFWGDFDGTAYKNTYFSKYPGKFTLGDSAMINPVTKGIIMCGRSDETLNPKGCRFGSSEIYNVVENFPEIRDSLCVAQFNKEMDERAILFVKMQDGHKFNSNLIKRLEAAITQEASYEHVPEVVLEVPDIPYNMNSKKMEIIVKKIINNKPHNTDMVINPECLKYFFNIPELQGY